MMFKFSHSSGQPLFKLLTCLAVLALFAGCSGREPVQRAEDHASRSKAYLAQGQYRAAMIEATNAVNAAPQDVQYRVALASIYNNLGSGRRASSLLEEVVEDHLQASALVLAEAYLAQGRFLSARELLERYEPENADQALQKALFLADASRTQGNLAESQRAYEDLHQQYPSNPEVLRRLTENAILEGNLDAAQARLNSLLALDAKSVRALSLQGRIAFERNDLELAERSLTEALIELPTTDIMLPERAAVLRLLSETLTARGRMTEAMVYSRLLAEGNEGAAASQQRYNEALAALESGDTEQAEQIFRALLEESPNNQAAAIMLGVMSLSRGDNQEAETLLSSHVDVETATSAVIRATVLAQAGVGDAEQALATLERAVKARPDDVLLLSMYGILALSLPEREQQGYRSLQKALSLEPHHSRLRLALARYHYGRGEREQGMAQLRAAFKYQPADWATTDTYINLLIAERQLQELATVVSELKTAAPKARETRLYEALLSYRRGDTSVGLSQLSSLLGSEPGYARGHAWLAQMQLESGQPQVALASLERVVLLDPSSLQPLQGGIAILSAHDLGQEPQAWLQARRAQHPDHTELAQNVAGLSAMLYREGGDLAQAVAAVASYDGSESTYLRQVKSTLYRDQAQAYSQQGNHRQAQERLSSALALLPENKALNLELVRMELAAERYSEAYALLDDLENRFPEDPELVTLRAGGVRAEQGDKQAYALLSRAWSERPAGVMAPLLINLASSQKPDSVAGILQTWERLEPESRARRLYAADWYQRQDDSAAAIQNYERILASNPQDAVALNNLAWLLKDTDLSRALAYAKSAAELQPQVAAILDTYGWLLHLQGNNTQALAYLERALELAPEATDIRKNRDSVRAAL